MASARMDGMREGGGIMRPKGKAPGKAMVSGEFIVKRRMHLSVVLGITFCVIGGAVVTSSLLLDWVLSVSGNESLWSLVGKGGIYLLAVLVPLAGLLTAIVSSVDVLADKGRKRFKAPASLGSLACALLAMLSLIAVALQINADFVAPAGDSFGPALFMSVFGGVLAVSGSIILTVDYLEARARKGRFSASGGSSQLRAVLRPSSRSKRSRQEEMVKEVREELLASKEARKAALEEAEQSQGLDCPNCHSPVESNWQICPICGEELQ